MHMLYRVRYVVWLAMAAISSQQDCTRDTWVSYMSWLVAYSQTNYAQNYMATQVEVIIGNRLTLAGGAMVSVSVYLTMTLMTHHMIAFEAAVFQLTMPNHIWMPLALHLAAFRAGGGIAIWLSQYLLRMRDTIRGDVPCGP